MSLVQATETLLTKRQAEVLKMLRNGWQGWWIDTDYMSSIQPALIRENESVVIRRSTLYRLKELGLVYDHGNDGLCFSATREV